MKEDYNVEFTAKLTAAAYEQEGYKFAEYFTNNKVKVLFNVLNRFVPKNLLLERVEGSGALRNILEEYRPEQIIEIGSGCSTMGLEWSLKHPDKLYIESDLPNMAEFKRNKLDEIRKNEGIKSSPNHKVLTINALEDNIYEKTKDYLKKGAKTLFITEGVTFYFNEEEHNRFFKNISETLDLVGGEGAYLTQGLKDINKKLSVPLNLVEMLVKKKVYNRFGKLDEVEDYVKKYNFSKVKTLPDLLSQEKLDEYPRLKGENTILPIYLIEK